MSSSKMKCTLVYEDIATDVSVISQTGCVQHAIFQRLTEDRVFNQIPCIFITAKGYPDIATR